MEENIQHSALLVMDMQTAILGRLPDAAIVITNVKKAIANAREKKIPVIYVLVGFRQGAPEINVNNKSFNAVKSLYANVSMKDFMRIHPDLAPLENEITVVKRRISAFSGSDLEIILKAFNIGHLVLTGVATSGVVLSTVREAADKDYQITVLSDCCADREQDVHELLSSKIFPRQSEVIRVEEWIKELKS